MVSLNLGSLSRLFDKKIEDPLFTPLVLDDSQIKSILDEAANNMVQIVLQAKGAKPKTGQFLLQAEPKGIAVQFDHNPFLEKQVAVDIIVLMKARKITGSAVITAVNPANESVVLDYPTKLVIQDQPRSNNRVSPDETDSSFKALRMSNIPIQGSVFIDISTTGCAFFLPRGVDIRGTSPTVKFSCGGINFSLQGVVKRWVSRPDQDLTMCGIQFLDTKENKRQFPALEALVNRELA